MWLQSHVTKVFSWRHSCFRLTSLVIVVTRWHYYFFDYFFFLLASSFFFCHISHSDGIMYHKITQHTLFWCTLWDESSWNSTLFFSKYNTDHARLFFCYSIFFYSWVWYSSLGWRMSWKLSLFSSGTMSVALAALVGLLWQRGRRLRDLRLQYFP